MQSREELLAYKRRYYREVTKKKDAVSSEPRKRAKEARNREIFQKLFSRTHCYQDIQREYGISSATIGKIVREGKRRYYMTNPLHVKTHVVREAVYDYEGKVIRWRNVERPFTELNNSDSQVV